MAQISYPKDASTSYNVSTRDDAIDALIERYGDRLQEISSVDKIGLLAILALWQHADSIDEDGVTLLDAADEYSNENSEELDAVIELIQDISDAAAFSLMVAITNQLVAENRG